MSAFLTPMFFWFGLAIPVVILLYILKLRRSKVVISSTLLWLKSLQDLTANAPFQRLRKNLLLFLQLLILVLLVTALARPFVRAEGMSGQNICVLIDQSASMLTLEGDGTRLDQAKDVTRGLIDDMVRGDKMMIVSFGNTADVLCELTDDRLRLRRTVEGIEAASTSTQLRDSVMVAHSLRETAVGDLHLVIVSDGKIADLDALGARVDELSFLQVGENRQNAGIVAFSMRELPEGTSQQQQTFVLVHNADEKPLEATVSLQLDDSVLAVEAVNVPPGEEREVLFAHAELGEGLLSAVLDVDDALAVDNQAWIALRPDAELNVLLVSEADSVGGYVFQRALALDSRVVLEKTTPDLYQSSDSYDLTVFESVTPESLPGGTLLFVNALPNLPGLVDTGTLEFPPVVATDREHPVMRLLHPETVGIQEAMEMSLPEGSRSLMSTNGGALIADVSTGGQQILVVGFDLAQSNWPTDLSFPLFVQNVLFWVPQSGTAQQATVAAGKPLAILPDLVASEATVNRPDATIETIELNPLREVYYSNTTVTGPYRVSKNGTEELYAVNLLDRTESSVGPAESLDIGRGSFEAQRERIKQDRELWRWLVLGGLIVLVLEWWVYSRRAWL
jgi:hypothetical protein